MTTHQPWLRLWTDMPNDPKWRTIAKVSKQAIPSVMAVYLHILVAAANATERGRTHDVCSEDVANALDLETEQVEQIMAAMQGRVLEGDEVSGWEKRQPNREDGSAERAKAWREAKKQGNKEENTPITPKSSNKTADTERTQTQPNAAERNRTLEEIREEEIREEKNTNTQTVVCEQREQAERLQTATKAGAVCVVLKSEGIPTVNPGHPELMALLTQGADVGIFAAAAQVAKKAGKHDFAYVLGIVKRQMASAAAIASTPMASPTVVQITVPSKPGVDPTLAKLDADDQIARKGPSLDVLAKMAQLRNRVAA